MGNEREINTSSTRQPKSVKGSSSERAIIFYPPPKSSGKPPKTSGK